MHQPALHRDPVAALARHGREVDRAARGDQHERREQSRRRSRGARAAGGHTCAFDRSVKYAANSPPKNISSDASQTTVPTASSDGRSGRACERDTVRHAAMMAHRYPRRGERRRVLAGPCRRGADVVGRCSATGRSTRSSCSRVAGRRALRAWACAGSRRGAAAGRPAGRSRFGGGLVADRVRHRSPGWRSTTGRCFSLHVVQHLLLGMVAPLFLVLGAPVTLALQASHRPAQQRWLRVLHSRPVAVVTHPALVWVLFGGTLSSSTSPALYELSLATRGSTSLVHAHFVVVGLPVHGLRRRGRPDAAVARLRRAPALRRGRAPVPRVPRRRAARQRHRARVRTGTRRCPGRGPSLARATSGSAPGSSGASASCSASPRWRSSSTSGCATRSARRSGSTAAWTRSLKISAGRSPPGAGRPAAGQSVAAPPRLRFSPSPGRRRPGTARCSPRACSPSP